MPNDLDSILSSQEQIVETRLIAPPVANRIFVDWEPYVRKTLNQAEFAQDKELDCLFSNICDALSENEAYKDDPDELNAILNAYDVQFNDSDPMPVKVKLLHQAIIKKVVDDYKAQEHVKTQRQQANEAILEALEGLKEAFDSLLVMYQNFLYSSGSLPPAQKRELGLQADIDYAHYDYVIKRQVIAHLKKQAQEKLYYHFQLRINFLFASPWGFLFQPLLNTADKCYEALQKEFVDQINGENHNKETLNSIIALSMQPIQHAVDLSFNNFAAALCQSYENQTVVSDGTGTSPASLFDALRNAGNANTRFEILCTSFKEPMLQKHRQYTTNLKTRAQTAEASLNENKAIVQIKQRLCILKTNNPAAKISDLLFNDSECLGIINASENADNSSIQALQKELISVDKDTFERKKNPNCKDLHIHQILTKPSITVERAIQVSTSYFPDRTNNTFLVSSPVGQVEKKRTFEALQSLFFEPKYGEVRFILTISPTGRAVFNFSLPHSTKYKALAFAELIKIANHFARFIASQQTILNSKTEIEFAPSADQALTDIRKVHLACAAALDLLAIPNYCPTTNFAEKKHYLACREILPKYTEEDASFSNSLLSKLKV